MSASTPSFTVLLGNLPTSVRSGLVRLLPAGSDMELVGPAAATAELPTLARRLRPTAVIVTEDQLLGLEQLRRQYPVPVLLYSSHAPLPGMLREAARLGVYDYVTPAPATGSELAEWHRLLKRKLWAAQPKPASIVSPAAVLPIRTRAVPLPPRGVVVIGGSTGGAPAVEAVIRNLPSGFPWAVLVAVHLPAHFTDSLVDRLRRATPLPLAAAGSSSRLEAGQILVAPGGHNLVIRPVTDSPWLGWQTDFVTEASLDVPSVDILMQSVARLVGRNVLGVVLTGLGHDGTAGARSIRQHGGTVIVQDEASSAVFGMPKSVIQAGLASEVLPLSSMTDFMVRHVQPLASGPVGCFSSRTQPVPAR
ncbi:chemotaxis protein CheB [Hymenobacter swuensis]|uniref:protein-glutamate methylesterase n=1 Tax=Hymenobacter swuensis DY53 TaxID=1227739 RepID=W8EZZ4_9BACT|nr:chemotaxis protein CheB [Hymenobacter swuensis]AHJ98213.1 chemotaxis response regulator protein-glutamate methylesterase CheB [Hymenobacter swuensis DY53]